MSIEEVYCASPRKEHVFQADRKTKGQKKDSSVSKVCRTRNNLDDICGKWHVSCFFRGCQYRITMKEEDEEIILDICKDGVTSHLLLVPSNGIKDVVEAGSLSVFQKATEQIPAMHLDSSLSAYHICKNLLIYRPQLDRQEKIQSHLTGSCMICFEECSKNIAPSFCGHTVCVDCWYSYLKVICNNSNTVRLQYPAEKCTATIDLLEASFLIKHDEGVEQDLWQRLVETEMKWFAERECSGFYCPNRYCSALITLPASVSDQEELSSMKTLLNRGNHVLYCRDCFQPVCAEYHKASHTGITCENAFKLE